MTKFATYVTKVLKPGVGDAFKPHILKNADAAVRDEPKCHHFHVITAADLLADKEIQDRYRSVQERN